MQTKEKAGSKSLKIIYHHRTLGDGAEGIHIAEMIAALRQCGHEIRVVSPIGEKTGVHNSQTKKLTYAVSENAGVMVAPEDPQALADGIGQLFSKNWDEKIIAASVEQRTWRSVAKQYYQCFQIVVRS